MHYVAKCRAAQDAVHSWPCSAAPCRQPSPAPLQQEPRSLTSRRTCVWHRLQRVVSAIDGLAPVELGLGIARPGAPVGRRRASQRWCEATAQSLDYSAPSQLPGLLCYLCSLLKPPQHPCGSSIAQPPGRSSTHWTGVDCSLGVSSPESSTRFSSPYSPNCLSWSGAACRMATCREEHRVHVSQRAEAERVAACAATVLLHMRLHAAGAHPAFHPPSLPSSVPPIRPSIRPPTHPPSLPPTHPPTCIWLSLPGPKTRLLGSGSAPRDPILRRRWYGARSKGSCVPCCSKQSAHNQRPCSHKEEPPQAPAGLT